ADHLRRRQQRLVRDPQGRDGDAGPGGREDRLLSGHGSDRARSGLRAPGRISRRPGRQHLEASRAAGRAGRRSRASRPEPRGRLDRSRGQGRSVMAKLPGGDWVVEALRAEGVSHVFGMPGVHYLAIYDALLRRPGITHILARHEQGAAFMADGYARSSGRPGVVVVTTGPGATNTLTPLAESYAGSIPVVTIMSDVASHLVGRDLGALHELPNQIDCFRPVCRMAETLRSAADIPSTIAGAFDLLGT